MCDFSLYFFGLLDKIEIHTYYSTSLEHTKVIVCVEIDGKDT